MKEEVLRLEKVTRIVDGVTLLDNFNLHIFRGEILGLVCINAHGEKELVDLLCRNLPLHYGRIYMDEILVNSYEESTFESNKVVVIEKENGLVEDLTVVDNIFVLRNGFKSYLINKRVLNAGLKDVLQKLDLKIEGNEPVSQLSSLEKCLVLLLKAVVAGTKLVVIKDISNYLSAAELAVFHKLIRYYCGEGLSFLYICNHHEEAFQICNRIALMENGKIIKVLDQKEFTDDKIKPYCKDFYDIKNPEMKKVHKKKILQLNNITTEHIKDLSFSVEKGECTVLLDMNNTILTDIIDLMNGCLAPKSGSILLDGQPYLRKNPSYALKKGVCFIHEYPLQTMVFKDFSYLENLSFLLKRKQWNLHLRKKLLWSIAQEYMPVVGESIHAKEVSALSPAALYSMIYNRVHLYNPKVVFCMQPFSGADMYLRMHIIHLLQELKKKGITVIILAVSLSDSLVVADRLMVIENGQLSKDYDSTKFIWLRS
ncbi:MAG: sugar ABC transporter ATP-binding protein [Lachnospiraceae bacterium]|jgi:ribose transport system ATP-binding protein|nr:sugar ABC transporter ATP-binding protein [Lachnospiraceae bacterium]